MTRSKDESPPWAETPKLEHRWRFVGSHGDDAPGRSLDTYEQCSRCGALRHDYRHNGGQTSPNYPVVYRYGASIDRDSPCLGLLGAARSTHMNKAAEPTRGAPDYVKAGINLNPQNFETHRGERAVSYAVTDEQFHAAARSFANGVIGGPSAREHVERLARMFADFYREGWEDALLAKRESPASACASEVPVPMTSSACEAAFANTAPSVSEGARGKRAGDEPEYAGSNPVGGPPSTGDAPASSGLVPEDPAHPGNPMRNADGTMAVVPAAAVEAIRAEEREACAAMFEAPFAWLCKDHGGEEAQRIAWMIRNRPAQAVVQEKKT